MTAKRGSRRRGGWRRKGGQLEVYVRVHGGRGGLRTRRFPLGTAASELQIWIDDTWHDYRRRHPRGAPGTLAGDVETYLKLLIDRPALQQARTLHLAWWCARFGSRARWSLQPHELETALNELTATGAAASTVKKYRTALYHLYTKLDGKNAPNPLRDVKPPREPDALPRWMPPAIIDAIFDAMPDRRYARKLDDARAALIYAAATSPHANRSAIAREYGISETMVRKIVDRRARKYDTASQAKARLRVMAYVGLPPAQIQALTPADIDHDEPSVLVRGRKKGGGSRTQRLPLTPDGVSALRALEAAKAWGRFSTSSVRMVFRRAVKKMCDQLEAKDETRAIGERLRLQLAEARPYDLRHSMLTEVQLATGNVHATQSFAMHADARMTRRYTLAAVSPELKAAADLLTQRRVANEKPTNEPDKNRETNKNLEQFG